VGQQPVAERQCIGSPTSVLWPDRSATPKAVTTWDVLA